MASNSHPTPLTQAFDSLSRALQRLEAAAAISAAKVQTSAAARESAQSEITLSWQQHCATVESERDTLAEENHFLKEDNLRQAISCKPYKMNIWRFSKPRGM